MSDPVRPTPGAMISDALHRGGFTLDDLAKSTRLRGTLLEQMQEDDFSETGGDVYARGHLRAIAGVLNIDADCLLAAYDEAATLRRPPAP